MAARNRRIDSRSALLGAVCALVCVIAPLPASSSSAPDSTGTAPRDTAGAAVPNAAAAPAPDSSVVAARDTTARAAADTAGAARPTALWTMDELKGVIGAETGGTAAGGEYRDAKNGRVAMLCALLVPGLGQMYNEKPFKAALAMGLETFYLSQIMMNLRYCEREQALREQYPEGSSQWIYHDGWATEYYERSVDWTWWSGAVVLGIVIDAYVDAKLDDMRFKVEAGASKAGVGVSLLVPY